MKEFDWIEKYDYVFISYSHLDRERVQPFLQMLSDRRVNFWYDKNIEVSSRWSEVLANRIENSKILIAFATDNYFSSEICKEELLYSIKNFPEKRILLISGNDYNLNSIERIPITDINYFLNVILDMGVENECKLPKNIRHIKEKKKSLAQSKDSKTENKKNANKGMDKLKQIIHSKPKLIRNSIIIMCILIVIGCFVCAFIYDYNKKKTKELIAGTGNTIATELFSEDEINDVLEQTEKEIFENPVTGDMLAQGLSEIQISGDAVLVDKYPWIKEFLDKTNEAMSIPSDQHPRGIEIWIRIIDGNYYVSEDYMNYAGLFCTLLKQFDRSIGTISGVRWGNNLSTNDSDRRAYKSQTVENMPALIFGYKNANGKVEPLFGFLMVDKSLVIPDYLLESE